LKIPGPLANAGDQVPPVWAVFPSNKNKSIGDEVTHNTCGCGATPAIGASTIVIGILLVCGLTQLGVPELATLTILIVPVVVGLTDIVAVPAAFNVIVWFVPPLMLYVTVEFGVPVNVKVVVPFSQIVVGFAVTLAVGNGKTVIGILLVCGLIQLGVPELATLTILIVPVVVGLTDIVAVPAALSVIV
jgi:hypothetical protein